MALLSINQLSAGYGKLQILYDISLDIESGQFIGIFGPNGSGKSTLIKTVFGLTRTFAGTIVFDSVALNGLPTEKISSRGIAYVPQTQNVFTGMSVRENLQLAGRQLTREQLAKGLKSAFEMFPVLHDRQSQRTGSLSGGERQMLAISIAFITRPRLMLLDEPSAALSPLLVTEIFRQLRHMRDQGIT